MNSSCCKTFRFRAHHDEMKRPGRRNIAPGAYRYSAPILITRFTDQCPGLDTNIQHRIHGRFCCLQAIATQQNAACTCCNSHPTSDVEEPPKCSLYVDSCKSSVLGSVRAPILEQPPHLDEFRTPNTLASLPFHVELRPLPACLHMTCPSLGGLCYADLLASKLPACLLNLNSSGASDQCSIDLLKLHDSNF